MSPTPATVDSDLCYRAMCARDPRFDGRFFIGVRSTGVYCRPICPARTPLRRNVEFYACAAAAQEAGFRACRRCRPESAPGTPAWHGSGAVIARALRMIHEGFLDDRGVPDLAARLGIGDRHLRRLFLEHLGTAPGRIARARRLHFARRLLDDTGLPVAEVAFASGYRSIRQFNHAMRAGFGAPPTELRRGRRSRRGAVDGGGLCVRLPFRSPLDWAGILGFLAPRAIPGVERVGEGKYARTVVCGAGAGWLEIEPAPTGDELELTVGGAAVDSLRWVVERARATFDLDADPAAIGGSFAKDRLLGPLSRRTPGVRVPGSFDGFELAVRAILGQQVTVRGATTLSGRLVERFGEDAADDLPEGLTRLFPGPTTLAEAPVEDVGLPGARAETIRQLARAVASGAVSFDAAASLSDVVDALTVLPGIGDWTAHYVAMRAHGEPDAFPASDLGLRKAAPEPDGTLPSVARLSARAESWRPWRSYAAMLLWGTLGGAGG